MIKCHCSYFTYTICFNLSCEDCDHNLIFSAIPECFGGDVQKTKIGDQLHQLGDLSYPSFISLQPVAAMHFLRIVTFAQNVTSRTMHLVFSILLRERPQIWTSVLKA